MKIAVISDIHSNYPVFKKAYEDALSKNVDSFIFLGDYITDGFDADKVIDIIKNSNGYAINGNREVSIINYDKDKDERWDKYLQRKNMKYAYDHLSRDNLEYLRQLPIYKIINVSGKKICIAHSSPYNVKGNVHHDSYDIFDKLIEDYDCDIYLFGHEHKYYHTDYKGKMFVNTGSIGLPSDGLPFKYGILTIDGDNVTYDNIGTTYNHKELKEYYENSDYYKEVTYWCKLVLMALKKGEYHPQRFTNYIKEKAKKDNLDISYAIPNDLFITSFKEYFNDIDE